MRTNKGKRLRLRKKNADVDGVVIGDVDINGVAFVVAAYGLPWEQLAAWGSTVEWPLEIYPEDIRIAKLPLESVRRQFV